MHNNIKHQCYLHVNETDPKGDRHDDLGDSTEGMKRVESNALEDSGMAWDIPVTNIWYIKGYPTTVWNVNIKQPARVTLGNM